VLVVGRGRRRPFGAWAHLSTVRLENVASVLLSFLRSIGVCEGTISLEETGPPDPHELEMAAL
jgi:hypothetical protein